MFPCQPKKVKAHTMAKYFSFSWNIAGIFLHDSGFVI